jgi:hypothetical protein
MNMDFGKWEIVNSIGPDFSPGSMARYGGQAEPAGAGRTGSLRRRSPPVTHGSARQGVLGGGLA